MQAIDDGTASEEDRAWHRILVNANKFSTSLAATHCVRRGIEALGGNGTIEDFSALPRLYRDAIVLESWEGTHNVLCDQVLRDLARFDALELVLERAAGQLPTGADRDSQAVERALEALAPRMRRSLAGEPMHFRRQLDTRSCAPCRRGVCSSAAIVGRRRSTFDAISFPGMTRRPMRATRSSWTGRRPRSRSLTGRVTADTAAPG